MKNLKKLRKIYRLTCAQVASHIGVSASCYRNYEAGHREPSLEILVKISLFYNVSTDYLLNLDTSAPDSTVNLLTQRYGLSSDEINILKFYITLNEREREQFLAGIDCIKNNSNSIYEPHLANALRSEEINLKRHKMKQKEVIE